jgi:hypothetical protein
MYDPAGTGKISLERLSHVLKNPLLTGLKADMEGMITF